MALCNTRSALGVVTARVRYVPSGSLTSHGINCEELWDGTSGLSSLSEKTRKSNHLQMSLQRKHFLLSYLKTLSVGPAGAWTHDLPTGRRSAGSTSPHTIIVNEAFQGVDATSDKRHGSENRRQPPPKTPTTVRNWLKKRNSLQQGQFAFNSSLFSLR